MTYLVNLGPAKRYSQTHHRPRITFSACRRCLKNSRRVRMRDATATALPFLTIREIRVRLDSGEISSVELTQAHLDRMAAVEPSIAAFTTTSPDRALATANDFDKRH